MKELIIIGAGPAGITAAVYAARKKMDFTVLSRDVGGQAAWSGDVENYTGYQFITGPELAVKFYQHMQQFNVDLKQGESVNSIKKNDRHFNVSTDRASYDTRTVIIASGKKPKLLNIPGEVEFKNKGVTYCATCDGPLFSGKTIAVIGGGNSALDAAIQMSKIALKTYIINMSDKLNGDAIMRDKVATLPNVEVMNGARPVSIFGDKFVTGMNIDQKGSTMKLPVDGIFIEIGLIPDSAMIDIVKKNDIGEIVVNCSAETSVPGIFAAGDVTDAPEKQIIIAAGDGAKAAMSAFRYLSTHT